MMNQQRTMSTVISVASMLIVMMMASTTTITTRAFSPVAPQSRVSVEKAGVLMKKSRHGRASGGSIVIRQMSSDPEGEQKQQPTISADGTFYDDEVR
mmetsp:Transcript_51518/g.124395  ORF Transcript_51518/g.124395 Transcript_51518/m.124395 type:complete len:97 (+) Transcript_51518:196-486(+)